MITGYPTLEGDVVEDEVMENMEGSSQQDHCPETYADEGA
jgi:hypothetical protein